MNIRERIRKNSELVQEVAKAQLSVDVTPGRDGAEWLNDYIEGQHEQGDQENFSGLASTLGSFFGECLISEYGGEWKETQDGWGIEFSAGFIAYPFAKVEKQLRNGSEDSVWSMFTSIPSLLKDHS